MFNLDKVLLLSVILYRKRTYTIFQPMESATVLIISIGVMVFAITGFAVYTSFGPPAKELRDPFDEHED